MVGGAQFRHPRILYLWTKTAESIFLEHDPLTIGESIECSFLCKQSNPRAKGNIRVSLDILPYVCLFFSKCTTQPFMSWQQP